MQVSVRCRDGMGGSAWQEGQPTETLAVSGTEGGRDGGCEGEGW
jgi:hypothetical protein